MTDQKSCIALTEICRVCNATKVVLSLGNMKKACPECNGTGYIRHEPRNTANDRVQHDDVTLIVPKLPIKKRTIKNKVKKPEPVLQV